MDFKRIMKIFLIWRIKHVSDKNFMLILAVIVGIAVGLAAVLMKNAVHLVREVAVTIIDRYSFSYLYIIFPALGILLTVLFVKYIVKKKLGHGIPMVLYNISRNQGEIESHNMWSRIVGSSLTVGFGGSVGLEGPIVATGAAIGSNIGRMFNLSYRQVILLIGCACTGAIAAIFKAPVAAIIFTLEVIMLDLTMSSLLTLLMASMSAALTSYLFMGQNCLYFVEKTDLFVLSDVPFYILFGVLCGLLSVYFSKLYLWINEFFKNWKSKWAKFVVCVVVLGGLVFLFPSLYGEGYESVNMALQGDISYLFENTIYAGWDSWLGIIVILSLIILLKIFATGVTFNAGGVGGIFAPALFLGANIGLFFSKIFNSIGFQISEENFALVGMAGLLAGIIHAPLTAIFLIAEITEGYSLFVPLMIVSAIAYFTVKIFMPNSVYTIMLAKRGNLLTHNADSNMLSMLRMENLIEKNFHTLNEDSNLRTLVEVIKHSNRNVYVVVDEQNNLKGLVFLDHVRHMIFNPEFYDNVFVRDLMYMPRSIVELDMSVREVAEIFEKSEDYNLPVVDNGKYIGFVSRAKVFSKYRQMLKQFSSD
ncbi:MAG: chloride channel protein [Bacteroidales bacterium]|nr:chloride channel protein [Bacteroidales bacterium]MDD4216731.1 chloride channel protein [Bacteroidales bacterium]MDY0140424.1 chloride channel protein [Bacteroidales bacterium]